MTETSRFQQVQDISINHVPIPRVVSTKFLGVYLDQSLSWITHIDMISAKISRNVGILSRVAFLLPRQILLTLYYSLIYPYLAYCNPVWASNYPSRLKRLQVLHRRALRIIHRSHPSIPSSELAASLGILNLDQITELQLCEFMYKHANNLLPLPFSNYFTVVSQTNAYLLRNALNYRPTFARTNTRKFFIASTGPLAWNRLPPDLRGLPTLANFKRNLKLRLCSTIP
jgi:hypothetical protein